MKNNIFRPKFFSILKQGYDKKQLSKDVFAGIIVGVVALPLAIAFAVASGVSPEKGIVTAIIAGFIISFLGGSRVQIGGPTGAFIVIVFGIVTQYGIDGLLISTILAGIMLVIFGVLRLGALLKYIPHPLIVGFTSGIALIIFSTQMKDAFGLEIANVPADFLGKWEAYFTNYSTVNFVALAITVATILISTLFRRITNKIPGSFVAIILMTLVVYFFELPVTTIETLFGDIKGSFAIDIPDINWGNISYYFAPAFTIALLGAIETLLTAVVADGMIGSNHRSNTELIAQGIANIVTPIFGGIPATGAIARTATNVKNGGRTPVAGMVHAVVLLLILLFFGKYAKLIPMSCLAGILIVVAYNMSEWRSFVSILRGSAFDIIILLTTFTLTVLVDLTVAIQIGVVLSAFLFMKRMTDTGQAAILKENESEMIENYGHVPKGIEIYEISGPFFFGAAKHYGEVLKGHASSTKVLIIRMRHVPFIDATGVHNFREAIKVLHSKNKRIILSGVQPNVRKELEKSEIAQRIGEENIFDNFDAALAKATEVVAEKQEAVTK
ncbi:MAG TPA: SulP family inorganic anion transporter [Bacteroidales bacterium]|jgi:SulP family sulfate permease|nr:SulP family inorganic anion transporter [Bacteroidales bacterium]HOD89361.1 SulP family inorganic anion transporter [Bacteroidales bacterium]